MNSVHEPGSRTMSKKFDSGKYRVEPGQKQAECTECTAQGQLTRPGRAPRAQAARLAPRPRACRPASPAPRARACCSALPRAALACRTRCERLRPSACAPPAPRAPRARCAPFPRSLRPVPVRPAVCSARPRAPRTPCEPVRAPRAPSACSACTQRAQRAQPSAMSQAQRPYRGRVLRAPAPCRGRHCALCCKTISAIQISSHNTMPSPLLPAIQTKTNICIAIQFAAFQYKLCSSPL